MSQCPSATWWATTPTVQFSPGTSVAHWSPEKPSTATITSPFTRSNYDANVAARSPMSALLARD